MINTVILNDHINISFSIRKILEKMSSGAVISLFANADEAQDFIGTSLRNNTVIDLLVTDFQHPGPNGYELAKKVRELEKSFVSKTMTIVLCTMLSENIPLIQKGFAEGSFNYYISPSFSNTEFESTLRSILNKST